MSELKRFEQILENQHINYFTRGTIEALKAEYEKALQQLREKEARIARLQRAAWVLVDAKPFNTEQVQKAVEILKETPQQSLAAIQADAVLGYGQELYANGDDAMTPEEYAQQLRDKADEPTS